MLAFKYLIVFFGGSSHCQTIPCQRTFWKIPGFPSDPPGATKRALAASVSIPRRASGTLKPPDLEKNILFCTASDRSPPPPFPGGFQRGDESLGRGFLLDVLVVVDELGMAEYGQLSALWCSSLVNPSRSGF